MPRRYIIELGNNLRGESVLDIHFDLVVRELLTFLVRSPTVAGLSDTAGSKHK